MADHHFNRFYVIPAITHFVASVWHQVCCIHWDGFFNSGESFMNLYKWFYDMFYISVKVKFAHMFHQCLWKLEYQVLQVWYWKKNTVSCRLWCLTPLNYSGRMQEQEVSWCFRRSSHRENMMPRLILLAGLSNKLYITAPCVLTLVSRSHLPSFSAGGEFKLCVFLLIPKHPV